MRLLDGIENPHATGVTPAPANRSSWIIAELAVLIIFLIPLVLRYESIGCDSAMYMHCAELILEGQIPYVDFIELNPPWPMFLHVPPALLSKITGISTAATFFMFVIFLLLLSWGEIRWILTRGNVRPWEVRLISTAWILANVLMLVEKNIDWGQKEHLFLLMYVPFLFARVFTYNGQRIPRGVLIWLRGVGGGGVVIKPHFVLIAGAIELGLLAYRRILKPLWSPEMISFYLIGLVYLLSWLFGSAGMKRNFFQWLVPLVVEHYSSRYSQPYIVSWDCITAEASAFGLSCLFMAVVLAFQRRLKITPLLLAFVIMAITGLFLYILQRMAWVHHNMPFLFASVMIAAILAGQFWREGEGSASGVLSQFALVAMMGILVPKLPWVPMRQGSIHYRKEPNVLFDFVTKIAAPGDPVLIYSSSVLEGYPLMLLGRFQPGSRYLWQFPAAFFSVPPPPDRMKQRAEQEGRYLSELTEDIQKRLPKLILVADLAATRERPWGTQGCPKGYRLIEYLDHTGILKTMAELGYKKIEAPEEFIAYVREKSA